MQCILAVIPVVYDVQTEYQPAAHLGDETPSQH